MEEWFFPALGGELAILPGGERKSSFFFLEREGSPHTSGEFLILIRTAWRKLMIASHGAGIWLH